MNENQRLLAVLTQLAFDLDTCKLRLKARAPHEIGAIAQLSIARRNTLGLANHLVASQSLIVEPGHEEGLRTAHHEWRKSIETLGLSASIEQLFHKRLTSLGGSIRDVRLSCGLPGDDTTEY